MSLDRLMLELQGRRPTDDELRRLYVIAKHLGVNPDDDAIMALYAALEWYSGIFSKIPDKIVQASDDATNAAINRINKNAVQLKSSFDAYAQQAASKAVAGMVEAVEKTANKTVATNNIKWIAICSGIITIILLIIGIFGATKISNLAFDKGFQAGVADARNTEFLLRQRDEFSNSDAFKLAFEYHKEGILTEILECKRPGWKVEKEKGKNICVPALKKEKSGSYAIGWTIPALP